MTSKNIATKWLTVIGIGFNPDTKSDNYEPALSPQQQIEYDDDMDRLWDVSPDPYADCLEAMEELGMI